MIQVMLTFIMNHLINEFDYDYLPNYKLTRSNTSIIVMKRVICQN
jgi:hypothetical protein